MDFNTFIVSSSNDISSEIQALLTRLSEEASKTHKSLVPLTDAFMQSCQGGKKLRGALVVLGFLLANGKKDSDIVKVAAAFEIFHSAILAHDDIIDRSPIRRGKPSLFKELGGTHYGVSQTITLGDIGFFLALKSVAESDFSAEEKNKAITFFTQCMIETGFGQLLDVALPVKNLRKEEDITTVMRLKTSRYSIIVPLQLGAILAEADEKLLKTIEEFGESIGIAYQLQDDILGIFGNEEVLGKSVTSDIQEGKITILFIKALEKANAQELKILKEIYGNKRYKGDASTEIKNVFQNTGALKYATSKVADHMVSAKSIIPKLSKDKNTRQLFLDFTKYLEKRKY